MQTWICSIFGAGTPLYLVSAESEKRAWELIEKEIYTVGIGHIIPKKDTSGLHLVPNIFSEKEQCINIYDVYSKNGRIINGSFAN